MVIGRIAHHYALKVFIISKVLNLKIEKFNTQDNVKNVGCYSEVFSTYSKDLLKYFKNRLKACKIKQAEVRLWQLKLMSPVSLVFN